MSEFFSSQLRIEKGELRDYEHVPGNIIEYSERVDGR